MQAVQQSFLKGLHFLHSSKIATVIWVVNQNDTVFQFIISQSILLFCFKATPYAEVLHHGVWKRKTAVWGDVFVAPGILLNTCVRPDHQTGANLARSYIPPEVTLEVQWCYQQNSLSFCFTFNHILWSGYYSPQNKISLTLQKAVYKQKEELLNEMYNLNHYYWHAP